MIPNRNIIDMKTNLINIKSAIILLSMMCLALQSVNAQQNESGNFNLSGQWQFNAPLGNDFSDVASGWGANIEAFYDLNNHWSAGAFISWHTNNKYFTRRTYPDSNSAVNMDSHNSLFQIPFGLGGRYKFMDGNIVPFAGLKIGANYAKEEKYSNIFVWKDKDWGFFVSPEIGVTVYPTSNHMFGFNLTGYYSYATNKYDYFEAQKGFSNLGFRVGVVLKLD